MKIRDFTAFLNKTQGEKKEIALSEFLDKHVEGTWKYNADRSVDVVGSVNLSNSGYLRKIPIKFNKVSGDFICMYKNSLESLEGCPVEVGGSFNCSHSGKLKNLVGSPKKVGGNYFCFYLNVNSLHGATTDVKGLFNCDWCLSLDKVEDEIVHNPELFRSWRNSKLDILEFIQKRRGQLKGSRFNI